MHSATRENDCFFIAVSGMCVADSVVTDWEHFVRQSPDSLIMSSPATDLCQLCHLQKGCALQNVLPLFRFEGVCFLQNAQNEVYTDEEFV